MAVNLENMETKIFKALAHPIRLKIIKKLSDKKLCVCELNKDVEFSQSNLSQHLKILKDAGILNAQKNGLWMHYSIKNIEILDVIEIIEKMVVKNIKEINEKLGDD
ncbi:ArsR/SmtB family transcription factor [Tepidibacter thalassicus]|uniref:ArsR family transcriptional regulator n=1 Tax=Tepidibacter thalassicus DSM 15285 TaxID=1123350 RepID=A0A1M5SEP5_9FIRM|nr:metalloregulator ArsR/SmtB family transcription factor [Tepidibacter thalassicus]SHH36383.1 ArsR family transcriptional regulator [Tepidibacter thalassicus DSM 15285]